MSGPVGVQEPTHHSLEPDTIDNLAHPTTCSLVVVVGGNYQMEVRKGLVYPHLTLLDDVQIDSASYVVLKVDMVHENAKNLKLEVVRWWTWCISYVVVTLDALDISLMRCFTL
jgi:hypothetical protein